MDLKKIDQLIISEIMKEDANKNTFQPTINVEDAFKVAEKLRLTINPSYDGWRVFNANASKSEMDSQYIGTTNNKRWVSHDKVTIAICLAALDYMDIKIE